jgi:aminopeptidase
MDTQKSVKYAEAVIEAGVNLTAGQCLVISCGVDNYDFALLIAETAYKKGARYVDIVISGSKLQKVRALNSGKDNYEYVPNYISTRSIEQVADKWAFIRIDNTEELDMLANVDSSVIQSIITAERNAVKLFSQEMMNMSIPWCIIAAPGRKWANKVYNNGKPGFNAYDKTIQTRESKNHDDKNYDDLCSALSKILKLDNDNTAGAWKEQGKKLKERALKLNRLSLDKLLFTSDGTELEIGLIPAGKWNGGLCSMPDGREFIPNIPTEEVFTTPDYKRTNGKAKVTRPVKVLEKTVTGAWFEFKNGKVISFGADKNKDVLERYFSIDEGASFLGEIALVDSSSPIFESGLVFNSILYDENAACHMALGNGLASCMPGGINIRDKEELKRQGCNLSLVHTDFMIGSPAINVTGFTSSGEKIEIIKDGRFVITNG